MVNVWARKRREQKSYCRHLTDAFEPEESGANELTPSASGIKLSTDINGTMASPSRFSDEFLTSPLATIPADNRHARDSRGIFP
jgi:hypothetical protein